MTATKMDDEDEPPLDFFRRLRGGEAEEPRTPALGLFLEDGMFCVRGGNGQWLCCIVGVGFDVRRTFDMEQISFNAVESFVYHG